MPAYRELFAQYDLTDQQWRVLRVLWETQHLTPIDISRQTLLPAPSLVGILDRLEKKGLIKRKRSSQDRRNLHISVTDKGKILQIQIMPQVDDIQNQLQSALGMDEWEQLKSLLIKANVAFAEQRPVITTPKAIG